MLLELFIQNFAIIDEIRINFGPGLNVMTGETGAGKSIILDAMALVLGDRADLTVIRDGTEQANVEATFRLNPELQAAFNPILEEEGLEGDQSDLLILAREVRLNGRNFARINGRAVNLTLLKDLGDRLVDIHGQGDHLSLLKPSSHLPLLDAYAHLRDEKSRVGGAVKKLHQVQRELAALRSDKDALAKRIDFLQYQVAEIDAAKLKPGEDEDLALERTRLGSIEQLREYSEAVIEALGGFEDDRPSVGDLLGSAEKSIVALGKLDPDLEPLVEKIQGLTFQINDLTSEIIHYHDNLDADPDRLNFVEERIELINRLKRKYGDSIEAILARREQGQAELDSISHNEERMEELKRQEDDLLHQIGELAVQLSTKRQQAGDELATAVEKELSDLSMERATFRVEINQVESAEGTFVDNRRLAFDSSGIDKIQFLVSANPGESPKPLARVASGGETSRLMLALKTVLARVDATPTLIFDEIDQGIGGRVGDIVGRKLWGLTRPTGHQVIVVTHLPQLAGYADGHFRVSKQLAAERTTTLVTSLDTNGRVIELAEMIGTQNEYATGGAESILDHVARVKVSV